MRTLEGHTKNVAGVTVTPEGRRAVSASFDKTLKVWDIETGLVQATFTCDAGVLCCACSGLSTLAGGDVGGRLHFLRLEE